MDGGISVAGSAVIETGICLCSPLKKHVGYLFHSSGNVKDVKEYRDNLVARRENIELLVGTGCDAGDEENKEVRLWLTRAREKENEVNEIVQRAEENKTFLCFPNLGWRFKIGKRASQMVEVISQHLDEGKFEKVTIAPRPPDVIPQEVPSIEGLVTVGSALTKVMDSLRDEEKKIIGVWGMGGIGKTTLVKNVNNLMMKTRQFNRVVMVIASKDVDLERLQDEIAERLGFSLKDKTRHSRTDALHNRLMKENKLLLIIDDLWQRIELAAVGIPCDNKACKILLTTRQEAVCRQMETQYDIKVDVLSRNESWKLFKEKVGDIVDDPTFLTIAKEVVEECGGLPLAIITLGRALRGVTNHRVWENALWQMKKSSPSDIEGMEDNVYQSIKISYDHLRSELKPAFLFCSLFPEDYDINVARLIRYWKGEGLLEDGESLEEIMNKGYSWIQELKSSSLLLDGEEEGHVKLHDIVRDVSVSIASREDKGCKSLVRAGVKMKGLPQERKWKEYKRISLIRSGVKELPKGMHCPNLLTLLMQENCEFREIPGWFLEATKALRVLDLSSTSITSLPSSLLNLVNLRELCLRKCVFKTWDNLSPLGGLKQLESLDLSHNEELKELPLEIGQLANLRRLDLTNTSRLTTIPCSVISNLSRLEVLKMLYSSYEWVVGGEIIKEREDSNTSHISNATLAEVAHLTELSCLELHIVVDVNQKEVHPLQLKHWVKLKQFNISICSSEHVFGVYGKGFLFQRGTQFDTEFGRRKLILSISKEDIPEWVSMLLSRTTHLLLASHKGLRRLGELGAFPSLEYLHIEKCEDMECVFSRNEAPNLHILELYFLSNLLKLVESDFKEAGEGSFPATCSSLHSLRELEVLECPKLKHVLLLYGLLQNMENLTKVKVSNCQGIEYLFGGPTAAEATATTAVLRGGDDVLSKLKYLDIFALPNMKSICPLGLAVTYFRNLTYLRINGCNGLRKSVLSWAEMKGGLPNLEELRVCYCSRVREIISEVVAVANEKCLRLLPKLRILILYELPELERVYGGAEDDAPLLQSDRCSLEQFDVEECRKLKKFQPLQGGANSDPSFKKRDV